MNRDEVEGKAQSLKGTVKRVTGHLTNNARLHDEGVADEVAGQAQDTGGRIRRKVGDAVTAVGAAIRR